MVTGPSTSDPVRAMALAVSSAVVTDAELATGRSSTGITMMVTVRGGGGAGGVGDR